MFKHSFSVFTFCSSICLLLGLQVAIASFPSNARPSLIKRSQIGTNSRAIMNKRSIVEKATTDHFNKRRERKGTKYNEMLAPGPLFAPQPESQPQPQSYKLLQTVSTNKILKERSIKEKGPLDHFMKRYVHKYNQMLPSAPAPAPQPQPKPQWPKPWWMPPKKRDEKKH